MTDDQTPNNGRGAGKTGTPADQESKEYKAQQARGGGPAKTDSFHKLFKLFIILCSFSTESFYVFWNEMTVIATYGHDNVLGL